MNKMKLFLPNRHVWLAFSSLLLILCALLSLNIYKIGAPFWNQSHPESPKIDSTFEHQPLLENSSTPGFALYDLPLPNWAKGFRMPIAGAKIPQNIDLLPSAVRNYRNGRHEGVDIYCAYGTPILAAKEGYVLAVGADYHELPKPLRERLLGIANILISTPVEITDILHGRRVILDHGISDGRWVVTVYSHLSDVERNLKPGNFIRKGDIIGYAGNSGTSQAGTKNQAHLHFEIRVNDHYLGEGMSQKEAGNLYSAIMRD